MNKWSRIRITCCALALSGFWFFSGCDAEDKRLGFLKKLDDDINAQSHHMQLADTRSIALPSIGNDEWIVAISGQYGGRVCQPSPLSPVAVQKISEYASSEAHSAFLLWVSGDRVVSHVPLSIAYSPSVIRPYAKEQALCALIASPVHRALVIECVSKSQAQSPSPAGDCEVVLRAVK